MRTTVHFNDPEKQSETYRNVIETATAPDNGGNDTGNDSLTLYISDGSDLIREVIDLSEVKQVTHREA